MLTSVCMLFFVLFFITPIIFFPLFEVLNIFFIYFSLYFLSYYSSVSIYHIVMHICIIIAIMQTFWNSSDRAGKKSQGPAILPSMPVRVSDKIFCLCILFCTGKRKCNWYAVTITINSELDSASNDIYFLNMQLFPW